MLKSAVVASLAVLGASAALAQPAFQPMQHKMEMRGWGQKGDPAQRLNERMSHFKSRLAITPAQEAAWMNFENTVKAQAAQRMTAMAARMQQPQPTGAPERMARAAENMVAMAQSMKTVADSAAPLYASLDAKQKETFDRMSQRMMMGGGKHDMRGEHQGMMMHGHHPGMMQQGMGGMGGMRMQGMGGMRMQGMGGQQIPPPPFMQNR